jgi:PAS domain S-box-containing protein
MHFNHLTLKFSGPHAPLEPSFHDYYFKSTLNQIRVTIIAALIFYGAFGVLDAIVFPDNYLFFWMIRWSIVCPCLVMVYLFSYSRHFFQYFQTAISLGSLICGFGIIAMIELSTQTQNYAYEGGLVQIIFFIFTFGRLRFIWGSMTACTLMLTYLLTSITTGTLPNDYLISKGFHLSLICLMGMMAGYAIEYQTRKNFFLSRQLELKKRRLAIANEFLEHRVTDRTSELRRTNELLKEKIKEGKLIESELRDSKKRYRCIMDNVTDHICVYDLNGSIMEANRPMISSLGYTGEELLEMGYPDLIIPEERAAFILNMEKILKTGTAAGMMTLVTREGEPRFFEYSNVLAEHTTGSQAVFSLARDITHRKKAEKALADSQLQFQNIFETAAAGMVIVESETQKVVEINSAATQMMQQNADIIIGQHFNTLISMPENAAVSRLPVPTQHPMECLLTTASKKSLPVLASIRETVFDDRPHLIISFINIQKIKEAETEKRALEIRANRIQHLEAIGTLAGGIAHDFNNILFGIMGFAELAIDDAAEESIQAKNLKEIVKGGHRAKEMISQILTFSRRDSIEKQVIKPVPLIKEALKLIRATFPSTIEIKSRFDSDLYQINANPTHIHQVVMNLCTNAAQALVDDFGRIEIRVENETLASDEQTPHGKLPKGDYFKLIIKDDGEGIAQDVIDRIFEPYFTTKAQGEGSGMGLSVVIGIVQALEGNIRVDSHPGQGTRFEVLIPATHMAVEQTELADAPLPMGSEHIMFIDDERHLLKLLKRMLGGLGYKVTVCGRAIEALEVFKRQPDVYDLVITDLTMPKMTGIQVAQELLRIRSDLPIILCTGYNKKLSLAHLQSMGIRELLPKPILKKDLANAIRRVVAPN